MSAHGYALSTKNNPGSNMSDQPTLDLAPSKGSDAPPKGSDASPSAAELVMELTRYNKAYRSGTPLISDREYDDITERLRAIDPDNAFLSAVEPEELAAGTTVRHATPMLSTEKAYTRDALERFVARIEAAAAELGETELTFRMTPKLDGLAGNDIDGVLATRGNGRVGSDITNAFKKGLVAIGGRDQGLGEIVIQQSYFEKNFTGIFEHPRNMAVGIIKADTVNADSQKALTDKMVHFVPYTTLAKWEGSGADLIAKTAEITASLRKKVDYALDGMVAEVTNQVVKDHMGATSHHNRWQIAIKERGETAITTIENIVWQTGRTGNITPVLEIKTIRLSGANINRVTAHNAGMVRDRKLGVGAQVEIIRSGEVIPKLESVVTPAPKVELVSACPCCETPLIWKGDFLNCPNGSACSAQVISSLRHFFRTLGTADGFGERNLTRLVEGGFVTLEQIYALTKANLLALEFGAGQTKNLLEALVTSRKTQVEDARFLASFGIHDLGVGDSRKLLRQFKIEALDTVTAEQLAAVKGFGAVTSESITSGITARWSTIKHMLDLQFTLERTPLEAEAAAIVSPISGKTILFTGKMLQGSRNDMKKQALSLGATISSSISKKLGYLVIGDKASTAKVNKAKAAGVTVLTETEYRALIAG